MASSNESAVTSRDEWAVVLGCSGGAGAAISRRLAQDPGLNVFGVHRGNHAELAAQTEAAVHSAGKRCHMRIGQAGDYESAVAGAAEIRDVAGPHSVRIFVHAIADASYGLFASGDERQFHHKQFAKTFDRMAHSFVYWVQNLLANDLLAEGATLLGLTNALAESAVNGWGMNSAAKRALESFVHHLGNELGPRGYRTMLLKFGLIETRAIKIAFSETVWQGVKERTERATPVRRLVTTDEVARFVSFLVGEQATWFNATTIDFTGAQIRDLADLLVNKERYDQQDRDAER